jgi:YegS/Rv2252/BmrU family lipid kinase
MHRSIEVIINATAGTVPDDEQIKRLTETFAAEDLSANIHLARSGADVEELARRAVKEADIVVAGGGDGTISTVAAAVAKAGKTLGILPLGTLNNFSKDLGIPQNISEAVKTVAGGEVKLIDVGEVNGRYFINNSSIGLYPRIVRKRQQQQRLGRGKWWAAAWATWRFFVLSPFLKATLELSGNLLRRKTPFIFVGNNDYEMDFYNIGRRLKLDEGNLSIYLLRRSGRVGLFLLVLHTLLGRLQQLKDFEEFRASKLTISTRRKRILVALDGEVHLTETPLEYRIHPKMLRVIVPREITK